MTPAPTLAQMHDELAVAMSKHWAEARRYEMEILTLRWWELFRYRRLAALSTAHFNFGMELYALATAQAKRRKKK